MTYIKPFSFFIHQTQSRFYKKSNFQIPLKSINLFSSVYTVEPM